MKDTQLIEILEKHIESYDMWTDGDKERVNAMKKCVNSLNGSLIYKEVA